MPTHISFKFLRSFTRSKLRSNVFLDIEVAADQVTAEQCEKYIKAALEKGTFQIVVHILSRERKIVNSCTEPRKNVSVEFFRTCPECLKRLTDVPTSV